MKYFALSVPDDGFEGNSPRTLENEAIDILGKTGVRASDVSEAYVIVPHDDSVPDVNDARYLPGRIIVFGGLFLLFSRRAWIDLMDLRLCPSIGMIPTSIRNRDGKHLATYHLLYAGARYDVLDRDKAEFSVTGDKQFVLYFNVRKWALASNRIPPYDLFMSDNLCWIATESLKERFENHGINNCVFNFLCEAEPAEKPQIIMKENKYEPVTRPVQ